MLVERTSSSTVDTRAARGPVRRFDRFDLRLDASSVVRHENGWLDVSGIATRSGVFLYAEADGSTRREMRPRSEVFDEASLATLRGVPLTNDHPVAPLDAQNTRIHQIGTVLDVRPLPDRGLVEVRLRVTDRDTAEQIAAGKVELSGGYTTDVLEDPEQIAAVELEPDEADERFDAIQTKIRYNHLALVDEARAGPVARLRLDGASQVKTIKIQIGKTTHEYRVDQIETVPVKIGESELMLPAALAAKLEAMVTGEPPEATEVAAEAAPADQAEGELEETETLDVLEDEPTEDRGPGPAALAGGRSDAAVGRRLAELERRLDAVPADVQRKIARRGELERKAGPILGLAYRYDAADDLALMHATIVAVDPELKNRADANRKDAGYLRGMFDSAVEAHAKADDSSSTLRSGLVASRKDGAADPIEDARKRYHDRIAGKVAPAPAAASN